MRRPKHPPPPAPPLRSSTPPQLLFVVGRGNLGRTLAKAFSAAGHRAQLRPARSGVPALVSSLNSVPNAIVFLAVPDGAVSTIAARLRERGRRVPETVAFVHLSGALGLDSLEPLRGRHPVGSFHPLQSFPEPRPPASMRGIVVAEDASTAGLQRRLATLARTLGARPKHVDDSQRAL